MDVSHVSQLEDNVTKTLDLVLNGFNLVKKEFLFNFLTQNAEDEKLKEFSNFIGSQTQVVRRNKGQQTKPDLVLQYKDGNSFDIEIKINDAPVTDSEGNGVNRNCFLIPNGYRYEKNIPKKLRNGCLIWEKLFEAIDKKFNGDFSELDFTRKSLKIRPPKTFESVIARGYEIILKLTVSDKTRFEYEKKDVEYSYLGSSDDGLWIGAHGCPITLEFLMDGLYIILWEKVKGKKKNSIEEVKFNAVQKKLELTPEENDNGKYAYKKICEVDELFSKSTGELIDIINKNFNAMLDLLE